MRSLETILEPVKEALLSVSENVGRHTAIDETKTHIIYYEEGEASEVAGDNVKLNQSIQGVIMLYAKPNEMEMFDKVQAALNNADISFSYNTTQVENGFIRYDWIFEVS